MSLEQKYKAAMLAAAGPWQKTHGLDPNGTYQGTCQACFGGFVVKNVKNRNKLVTVLHGYERPGHGYIIGECPGRDEEPFEVDKTVAEMFRDRLVSMLGRSKNFLARLKSGETTKLLVQVKQEDRSLKTQEIVKGWINPINSYDNFERRLTSKIHEVEVEVSSIERDLRFVQTKIDGWKYQPQALTTRRLKHEMAPSELTGKSWYDHPDVVAAMLKMPSPDPARGSTFRQWAETFPHVLLWMGMNGRRTPSYYDKVKDTFAKQPGVKTSLISAVVRKVQQLDDTKIEKEKLTRSQLDAFMSNQDFVAFIKTRKDKTSIYNAGSGEPAKPGEKTLFDHYEEKIKRAEGHPNFTDRQYSMKRIIGDFKDLTGDYGAKLKIKLPRAQKKA